MRGRKIPRCLFTDTGEKSACLDGLQGGDLYSLVGGVVAGAKADSHREQHRSQQQPGRDNTDPGEGLAADDGGDQPGGFKRTGEGGEVDADGDEHAHHASHQAAQKSDGAGLGEEEQPDVPDIAAQGFHDADLPGAL